MSAAFLLAQAAAVIAAPTQSFNNRTATNSTSDWTATNSTGEDWSGAVSSITPSGTPHPTSITSITISIITPGGTTNPTNTPSSIEPAGPSSSTSTPAPPSQTPLSLTQQLALAPLAVDRYSLLPDDNQFVFDFTKQDGQGSGSGSGQAGNIVVANRQTFPPLVGTGSGMAVGMFGPCGMNVLHTHPRGTELQIVVAGRLVVAMVPEDGAGGPQRVVTNTIYPFQMTPFYQGAYHVQYNPDCTNATFVGAFNGEDLGRADAFGLAFALPDDVLAPMFGQVLDGADLDKVRAAVPENIARGVEECLAKCNIQKR